MGLVDLCSLWYHYSSWSWYNLYTRGGYNWKSKALWQFSNKTHITVQSQMFRNQHGIFVLVPFNSRIYLCYYCSLLLLQPQHEEMLEYPVILPARHHMKSTQHFILLNTKCNTLIPHNKWSVSAPTSIKCESISYLLECHFPERCWLLAGSTSGSPIEKSHLWNIDFWASAVTN